MTAQEIDALRAAAKAALANGKPFPLDSPALALALLDAVEEKTERDAIVAEILSRRAPVTISEIKTGG